ncbi:MAG: hypothetical protein CGU28_13300 [Candidatus Dactylopiibacterium carminicum]|uniref:Lactate dehydrogenase n=1 Tax=Candidatus Dactylopiibacterium carminicum TaxID=857335 RepID=A0A272EP58_9RHOO|nr:Ldh family oxidoreductase [Candidatus Dactylopiibacterium carminicum]KAF7598235.1 hypothetical protein BGI27_14360 [Candidatus Dactylopiibacterium carminicum]PAS91889.1 MAG: hypothetical protein CGU29_13990 [Candidatus Dactylopiibacterium carminicum]PAS94865.1 MAG: hypothetical protein CGU28_13300 [Candidatus Dactylopiibacterium carminicum]PAS97078.1 MAG: hypothetical protein BSR46_14395 [Candidatus Dactylopiibacterium carminicum]
MPDPLRIPYPVLCEQVAAALIAAGVPDEFAREEASIMAEADLLEVPSHGVRMLPGLLAALRDGRARAQPEIALKKTFAAVSLLDGGNGPGRSLSARAMREAIGNARVAGIGACMATRTTHWGRAHAYAARAAQAGLIGICTTNAMPSMAAWGATDRVIGNNPLAIAIPRRDTAAPLVLDIAMSQAAVGKVGTWLREGHSVPEGWGLDKDGNPSRDAAAILAGAVLPFGGHKGAGLALMMELMTAALANTPFGNEIHSGDRSGLDPESAKLFIALEPAAFGGLDALHARVEDYLTYLQREASTREPFLWPGERGWQARDTNLAKGVPLHAEIVTQLAGVGVKLDV